MRHYFKGYCRCREFLPTLKTFLEENDWNIVDENFSNAHWFVAQKRASRGDILTITFKDTYYPAFGNPVAMIGAVVDGAAGESQNEDEVYISAYTPLDTTLHNCWTGSDINVSTYTSGFSMQYYSAAKVDSELDPSSLYYSISIIEDALIIRVRGNPATSGYLTKTRYFGPLDYTSTLEDEVLFPTGCWGTMDLLDQYCTSTYVNPGEVLWTHNKQFTRPYDLEVLGPVKEIPIFLSDAPQGHALITEHDTYKHILVPTTYLVKSRNDNSEYTDEITAFMFDDTKKILYKQNYTHHSIFAWIAEAPISCTTTDVGNGYKIDWVNPDVESLNAIEVYASTVDYPVDREDANATLIYTNSSPTFGAADTFTDTDAGRYAADTTYYTVFANELATPENQWTLKSKSSKTKTYRMMEDFSEYSFSDFSAIVYEDSTDLSTLSVYHNPTISMPMNDAGADSSILDVTGNMSPVAHAVTSSISTTGKLGNALDNTGINGVVLYLDENTDPIFNPMNYTISSWMKIPSTITQTMYPLYFNTTSSYGEHWYISTDRTTLVHAARYWYRSNSGQTARHYDVIQDICQDVPRDDWVHYMWVKRGYRLEFYINNTLTWVGMFGIKSQSATHAYFDYTSGYLTCNPITGELESYDQFSPIVIGANSGIDSTEFFRYPVSKAQRDKIWNGGAGIETSFVSDSSPYGIIATPGSANEEIFYKIKNPYNGKGKNTISIDIRASRIGSNFEVYVGPNKLTMASTTVNIAAQDTWQTITVNVSGLSDIDKDPLSYLKVKILNDASENIIFLRNITATY